MADEINGKATHLGGKIKEGIGDLLGDREMKREGRLDQMEGAAEQDQERAMEAAEEAAGTLAVQDLEPEVVDEVEGELWAKVVVNAGINPVTAITGLPNGALLRFPFLTSLMMRACEEVVDVAKAAGVRLPDDDLFLRARRVAELTAANKSSMLQDVERARRTEIDAICGEVVRRGRAAAVDTPVNETLLALVKGVEATTVT